MSFPILEKEEIPLNISTLPPLLRSLSKSNPRTPTQKLHPAPKSQSPRTEDDIRVQPQSVQNDQSIWSPDDVTHASLAQPPTRPRSHLHLENLPLEILETIAGYLVGRLGSTSSAVLAAANGARNWNEHMRHPRRKDASDLAFVSRTWRRLIQERLYRHIKVQGTISALNECSDFFLSCPHLQPYVRHLQVISPIWEVKGGKSKESSGVYTPYVPNLQREFLGDLQLIMTGAAHTSVTSNETNQVFQLASSNATVEEIFSTAKALFPELSALTIEAGHCKRPPQMKYFRPRSKIPSPRTSMTSCCMATEPRFDSLLMFEDDSSNLPELPKVAALVIKGAWNVIRTPKDFLVLSQALPGLKEFNCGFHSLKTQAYATMSTVIKSHWPNGITHLNIGLDGLYTKANSGLQKWRKIYPKSHICLDLASHMPTLISLTYTGRICSKLFEKSRRMLQIQDRPFNLNSSLKSIDLVVNNLCCDPATHNDATGVHHLPFIDAFERLIFEAVVSLSCFLELHQLRIRFIDLDSPNPLLNPMFHLEKERAWGMWSENIMAALQQCRPKVRFLGRRGRLGTLLEAEEFQEEPKRSTNVNYYRTCAHGGALIH